MTTRSKDVRPVAPTGESQGVWRSRGLNLWEPFTTARLALQRLRNTWPLLATVTLGMVVAVALLGAVPLYNDLVAEAKLQSALFAATPTDRNIQVDVVIPSLYGSSLSSVNAVVGADATHISQLVTAPTEYLDASRPFTLTKVNGRSVTTALPEYPATKGAQDLAMAFDYAQAGPHMKLLAGRLPRATTTATAPPEIIVTPALGAQPGTVLHFVDSAYAKFGFDARVVGVWTPKNPQDPFWNGRGFDTVTPPNLNNPPPPQYPILFTRAGFLGHLTYKLPDTQQTASIGALGMVAHYIYAINPSALTISQIPTQVDALTTFHSMLDGDVPGVGGASSVAFRSAVGDILASVANQLSLQTLPLDSVVAELMALALLFIFTMTGLLIESQAGEIATLKSRGASVTQVMVTYLTQGALAAVVAVVAGIGAAGGLSLLLVRYFVPLDGQVATIFTPAYAARSISPRDALIPALAGAGLGLLALAVAVWQAARRDALAFRRDQSGRDPRPPFWRQYYLDLGLALLCLVAYSMLATFGAQQTRSLLISLGHGSQTDLVEVLTPTLMLIAGALILQRALPWLTRAGAWLAARGRGATGMLAFSGAARAGGPFARLTLLLTFAVGLGLFGLTFRTTLAQGARDDARYFTGADERVVIKPQSEGTQSTLGYAAQFAHLPGAQSVAPLYRGVALTMPNQGSQNMDVLAVDPRDYAAAASEAWRADYASPSLPALMALLRHGERGAHAGEVGQPMVALVDPTLAATDHLQVGQRFMAQPQEAGEANSSSGVSFIVGAIVNDFPTLYDEYPAGYMIVDLNDYLGSLSNPALANYTTNGPNEFLLRTTPDAGQATARARALADPNFFVQTTYDARALTTTYRRDPLAAGVSGLLTLGALVAALLALVGVVAQAGVSAGQRKGQFAILRTLGVGSGALTRMLLIEQALIYLFGALGGLALGALLAVANLPFLATSSSTYLPPTPGVPSAQLAVNGQGSLIYLGALVGVCAVALIVVAVAAHMGGLGEALRVGED